MIVIFSPYPYEPLRNDGMFRRILEIDKIFSSEERYYVYYEPQGGDYRIREPFQVDSNAYVQLLDFHYTAHHLKLREYINNAQFVYAQTMIYSSSYLSSYYSTGKIITDAHGIAAEEERLVNRFSRGMFMEKFESYAVRNSKAVVVVTQAMADFYRKTYHCPNTEFIHIPICMIHSARKKWPIHERRTVIYAGGLHLWQNVELMLDIVAKKSDEFDFIFLTAEVDAMRKMAADRKLPDSVMIKSVPHEEVEQYLSNVEFGFLLRDDTPVNNVAFPTKLIEYLANGVIPVIKSPNVGDYLRMGVKGISMEDFLAGNIPSAEEMSSMMNHNYDCYLDVFSKYEHGIKRLKEVIASLKSAAPVPADDVIALPTQYRTTFLPLNIEYSYICNAERYTGVIDVCSHPLEVQIALNEQKNIKDVHFCIPGKTFVFKKCVLKYPSENEEKFLPLENIQDFPKDKFGNFLYENNMLLIFSSQKNFSAGKLELHLEIVLYDTEAASFHTGYIDMQNNVFKRFFHCLKHEGTAKTIARSFQYFKKYTAIRRNKL